MTQSYKTASADLNIWQEFGALASVRIGLSDQARAQGMRALNRLLVHTMAIRDAHKKAHYLFV